MSGPTFADLPAVEPGPCTALAARWCPVHGSCSCPEDDNAEACPLHGLTTDHPR